MSWTHQPQDCASCKHSERRDVTGFDEQGGQVTVPAILCVHPRQVRRPYPVSASVMRDLQCRGEWWARR